MSVDGTTEVRPGAGDRSRIAALSLARLTDRMTFSRATDYVDTGAVVEVALHDNPFRISGRVQGTNRAPYTCAATVAQGASGLVTSLNGVCSCPVVTNCKHVFAMAITAFREMRSLQATSDRHLALAASNGRILLRPEAAPPPPAAWQRSLADLLTDQPADQDDPGEPLGLQVELIPVTPTAGRRIGTGPVPAVRVGLRPVVRGRKGGWIRTGISWDKIGAHHLRQLGPRADHVRLLREINLLHSLSITAQYFSYDVNYLYLDGIGSRRIWDLLTEARSSGLEIAQSGRGQLPVTVADGRAEIVLEADRTAGELVITPTVSVDGHPIGPVEFALLGDPVHGIAYWPAGGDINSSGLTLVPSSQSVSPELRQFLTGGAVRIPSRDEADFVRDYLPRLSRRVPVVSRASVIAIPEKHPPMLSLTVTGLQGHRVGLAWEWLYRLGDSSAMLPLWSPGSDPVPRDRESERVALQALSLNPQETERLTGPSRLGRRLAARVTLEGLAAVDFFSTTLPRLRQLPRLNVTVINELTFRQAEQAPVISLSHSEGDDRDWFNLGITVTIDGEEIPFDELFKALAAAEEFMILPSGTYFALEAGPFEKLRRLIEEARGIEDVPGRSLISRFQASLWNELTDLGVVTAQAAAWQKSVGGLLAGDEVIDQAVPTTLKATLRPYQQDGFNWLTFLHDHGLGGVLADDMGLGKTVQTLALICHARLERPDTEPFLVVAPTSVVGNWAAECAKFAPGLRVVAITETTARGGLDLPELIRDADITVTSYALFRLDFAKYSALSWSGLILDEAQVVKNHLSKAFHCAIKLSTPFKLAITGTPMENNLLELWSMFALTAPGLFPPAARFREYYQTPIERSGDSDRLAQLRRRVRPLMLRRTKEEVAKDLPPKQEQVIELEMNAQHRNVYETHLQRERQKVLGLIDDMSKNRFEIFRSLTLLRQLSLDASLVDEQYAAVPSTKLDALMEQIEDIVAEGHRTLVFSQFTGFLDKVRKRMNAAGVQYCYLDGTTRNRPAVIAEFKSGTAPVFLISLKAGGVGLNLTEADYCILLDPWWNPATEAQAIDRIHRIGQTKNVMVYRLVAKDTIEEKVMALKATKAKLFSSVMDSGTAQATALTAADIRELLS